MKSVIDISTAESPRFDAARSERGASIVLALVFFLICAVVSGIIIGSASVNAERGQQQTKEEQAYLNLKSAANFIPKLFYPTDTNDYSKLSIDFSVNPPVINTTTMLSSGNSADIATWIFTSAKTVHDGGIPAATTFTVHAENPYAGAMPYMKDSGSDVNAEFSMGTGADEYKIFVLMSTDSSSNNETELQVVVPPTVTHDGGGVVTNVIWDGSVPFSIEKVMEES